MSKITNAGASKRAFIKHASALSAASIASPLAINLAAMGSAAAASANDYKALVCIFLSGGNDNFNTLIPFDPDSHAMYKRLRVADMVQAQAALAGTALPALAGGRQYALHPAMKSLAGLFHKGNLAVQLNVGPLIEPVTKVTWGNRTARVPRYLFAHDAQRETWQTGLNQGAGFSNGWAGRMGDLFEADNNRSMFTAVSVGSQGKLLRGQRTRPYNLSPGGATNIRAFNTRPEIANQLHRLITQPRPHNWLKDAYQETVAGSLRGVQALNTNLAPASSIQTPFPAGNDLADNLKMVARMIASADRLNVKRQIFFVSMDGFDLHDAFGRHAGLLDQLSRAMAAFFQETVAMGMSDQVTTFTASDFGRSLQSNNDGTDHGWGGDHFILGGAVKGSRFYGVAPTIASNGPDDVGQGRLIPSTAADQYASTLGRWFGLSDSQLLDIMPNLANFPRNRSAGSSFV